MVKLIFISNQSWESMFPDNEKDELLDLDNKMISTVELATMLKLIDGCN
jgi:hypothetical protein